MLDLIVTELDTITGFAMDGSFRFILDELQNATIANTQDKEDITGKGGRLLSSLKKNKGVTISGTNGIISGGLLEAQTGGEFTELNSTAVKWTDYLKVGASHTAVTTYKAIGTAGAEIMECHIRKTDGSADVSLEQAAQAAAGKFAYAAGTKTLTFHTDVPEGTEIVVIYMRNVAGSVLENVSDNYSETLELFVDAIAEDKCSNQYRVQFHIPKADFNGEFEIAMGDSQAVHAFEASSLSSSRACSTGSAFDGTLWTYTVFGVNAPDAA